MRLFRQIVLGKDSERSFSLRQLLSTTPSFILIGLSIFCFVAFQYYGHANYRNPTSYFFDPSRAYERIYSTKRIEEADAFIKAAANVSRPEELSQQPPVICIGIATIARRDEQYVRTTIGSLLEGLSDEQRRSIYLNLFIAHTDPSKHPIYEEKWVQTLPNNLLKYEQANTTLIRTWEDGGWYRNKTIFDYTYLLRDCYDTGARYIAMFEDDTLAVRGWYPRVVQALQDVETAMRRRPAQKWIYLRLFYVEGLLGWNSEDWAKYLFWSFATWLVVSGCLLGARTRSRRLQMLLSNASIATIACICLPALIGLHFLAGPSPLAPGIHEMNKYGCCSQGYVFPREIVEPFLQKTDLVTDWLVDMMVEKIADEQGYIRWATVPDLLQHIGTLSSKGWGFDESAKTLWNFGFELHDGVKT
ncbi:hypothetical protein LSUE1_G008646 [Lachnellula suecica]|uniref:Integral membrane protein n=1 Tax=Lachnellula suecica TaxID=602035 RepID=A0A8T9C287_9HELO|nr:hypothetical protein LSUE1_G008646 [Lachnellula suecica]